MMKAEIVFGGKRLLDAAKIPHAEKRPLGVPLEDSFKEMRKLLEKGKNVAILADGDPLFFGIGSRLLEFFPEQNIRIHPNVNTVSLAAARSGLPWQEICVVSLHGRNDSAPLFGLLQQGRPTAVFTDRKNTPARIAEMLEQRGVSKVKMTVFSMLGTGTEQIESGLPEKFLNREWADLNIVFLLPEEKTERGATLGTDDSLYVKEKGLITKRTVRCTGLGMLDLQDGQTVWDLGAGCGSVSIEASAVGRCSRVIAVERNRKRIDMIRENIGRFRAWSVEAIEGEMPGCLEELPNPDRIFMGGGLGRDSSVLEYATERLKPGGRIVVHTILMGSMERCRKVLDTLDWKWEAVQLQCSISDSIAGDHRFEAQNPVTIFMAEKPL